MVLGKVDELSRENQRLYCVLFQELGIAEDDALGRACQIMVAFVQHGVDAGFVDVADVDATADFPVSGGHGALVSAMMAGRTSAAFVAAVKEPVLRLLGIRGTKRCGALVITAAPPAPDGQS